MHSNEPRKQEALLTSLIQTVKELVAAFNDIAENRKEILRNLAQVIHQGLQGNQEINLNFICTHNSRRSHMAQLWAQAAAHYYRIPGIECFSGGTEATAFNPLAVETMRNLGFEIHVETKGTNPKYTVKYSEEVPPLTVFSKRYDDPFNPESNFVAIMTCSHADENCPLVRGASERIAITYNDPKDFDGMP